MGLARESLGLSLLLALAAPTAQAQSAPATRAPSVSEPSRDPQPATEVRAGQAWAATDEVERAPVGNAVLHLRLVLPGDFGGWAAAPQRLGPTSASLAGGDIAFTPHWSLVLEGADDPFARQFSGMVSGLRLHLAPIESDLQLSLGAGFTADLAGGLGLWSELNAAADLGAWHFASTLRASRVWGPATQPSLSGNGGVAVDLKPARLELESAVEQRATLRAALLPSIVVPTEQDHVMLRAGPVIPVSGQSTLPARVSLFGNF